MSALGIGLAWAALTALAFLALSASALARTRGELEADPWVPGEPGPVGVVGGEAAPVVHGARMLWTLSREHQGALADASW